MLDIYRNNSKKTTTAVIKDSTFDAVRHIARKLGVDLGIYDIYNDCDDCDGCEDCSKMKMYENIEICRQVPCADKALMNNRYSGTVTCDDRDTYDEAVGEDEAVKKAMANHNRGFMKAIVRWQSALIKQAIDVSPETFDEALKHVHTCTCCKDK